MMKVRGVIALGLAAGVATAVPLAHAQVASSSGQNVAPAYEGWEQNDDGSFNLVFGYFNRNWDERVDQAVGAGNSIEPGGPDQGQPTHFFPRRNRFVFRIRVPADFGDKELVWTLTSHGETERAYATLQPDYFMDDTVIMNNKGAGGGGGGAYGLEGNKPPELRVDGDRTRTVAVGEPVSLAAFASDDGIPKRRAMPRIPSTFRATPDSASGLRLSWFVYRGAGNQVTFDPQQIPVWEDFRDGSNSAWSSGWEPPPLPPDGKWLATATFSEPGTYVIRALADDGGLMAHEDVTIVVNR
jgi:hypothetical protein